MRSGEKERNREKGTKRECKKRLRKREAQEMQVRSRRREG